jgi:phosphoserine / homoserine phosphotransferase
MNPTLVTLDLEGVLVPEIWIAVAETTGIAELRLTTRDIQDYDELMAYRINVMNQHKLTLSKIQEVIHTLSPLEGALEFLNTIRSNTQVIILSDTFSQFAQPLMEKLGLPTLFCHSLIVHQDAITGYELRMPDQKKHSVAALRSIGYKVVAAGDSFNDTSMLGEADYGYFFHAPENVTAKFPQFPVMNSYEELWSAIKSHL